MAEEALRQYTEYAGELNLNLGCGTRIIRSPGKWLNVDGWCKEADLVETIDDLGFLEGAEEFANGEGLEYDFVLASHVMEHISSCALPYVVDAIWNLLRPGGTFVAITPHGRSDDAWDNPHHLTLFSETTWHYFTPFLYELSDTAGVGAHQGIPLHPWHIIISMVPQDEHKEDAKANFPVFQKWARKQPNVWREVHAIMTKPLEAQ